MKTSKYQTLEAKYLKALGLPLLVDIQTKGISPCMDAIEKKLTTIWMQDRDLVPFILCVTPQPGIGVFFPNIEHSTETDFQNWFRLALAVHHQGVTEYLMASEVWQRDNEDHDKITGEGVQITHYRREECTARYAAINNGRKIKYLRLPFEERNAVTTSDCNPRFRAWATVAEVADYFTLDRVEVQALWDAVATYVDKPLEVPTQLNDQLRRLFHRRQLGRAYAEQRQKSADYFPATYMEVPSKKSGLVRSACTWGPGYKQALPRTEYVCLVPAGANGEPTVVPRLMFVPWGHVEKTVGHLMKPMGMSPERYYIESFPDADELARLQEYEPDAIADTIKAENCSTPKEVKDQPLKNNLKS